MIDELLEYKQYTDIKKIKATEKSKKSESSNDCLRLKCDYFLPNLTGLERVLTIIARKLLFDEYKYDQLDSMPKQLAAIEKVKYALSAWCSFNDSKNDSLSFDFEGYLEKYYNELFLNSQKNAKPWESFKRSKKAAFDFTLFYNNAKENYNDEEETAPKKPVSKAKAIKLPSRNTFKAVNYEKVIASAINYGPLAKYCIVCKKDYAEHLYHNEDSMSSDKKNKNKEYRDEVVKFIGVYLIEMEKAFKNVPFSNNYVVINKTGLAHWLQKKVHNADYFKQYFYNNTQLIHSIVVGGNTSKSKVDPDYIKEYDFHICDITDKKKYTAFKKHFNEINKNSEYIFFTEPEDNLKNILTKNECP